MKPRIAFVVFTLPAGGGTVFLINLAGELIRRGYACCVFSLLTGNELAADFVRAQIPVVEGRGMNSIFEDRVERVLEVLKSFAPTTVIASAGVETCEVLRHLPAGIQRIGVFHVIFGEAADAVQTYGSVFDCMVGVSPEVQRGILELLRGRPAPVHCLELGVAIPREVSPRTFPPERPLRILYLGRLDDRAKRVRLFPAIYERLLSARIPFVWTLGGEGQERAYLESRMPGHDSSASVRFIGIVPHFHVPELLAEQDVFLLTSETESFCLSLHEAMVAGMVPVVSAIPGRVSEVVTSQTGCLVPPENPAGYADAIVTLHFNRLEMAAKSAAAREMITREHSVEVMADRWLAVLEPPSTTPPAWPRRWQIGAPLALPKSLRFAPALRLVRRLLARLRR